jgi:hypothetical protein
MKAAVSLIEDVEEGTTKDANGVKRKTRHCKIMCVYSKKFGAWMLPGSDAVDGIRPGETPEIAQARILLYETGLRTVDREEVYNGPNGIIWSVKPEGTSRNTGFLSREEFLNTSPFKPFYTKLFAHMDNEVQNNSRVVLKAASGKILIAYVTESYRKSTEGVMGWWLDKAEYMHALSVENAKYELGQSGVLTVNRRLFEIAPAIGFKVESETKKGKILVA